MRTGVTAACRSCLEDNCCLWDYSGGAGLWSLTVDVTLLYGWFFFCQFGFSPDEAVISVSTPPPPNRRKQTKQPVPLPFSYLHHHRLVIFVSPSRRAPGILVSLLLPSPGVRGWGGGFSRSVKSAAALMAQPSRAVIQTPKLLQYKSHPGFTLAGDSSRARQDYLFISRPLRTRQPAVIWWLGDDKIQTFNPCSAGGVRGGGVCTRPESSGMHSVSDESAAGISTERLKKKKKAVRTVTKSCKVIWERLCGETSLHLCVTWPKFLARIQVKPSCCAATLLSEHTVLLEQRGVWTTKQKPFQNSSSNPGFQDALRLQTSARALR